MSPVCLRLPPGFGRIIDELSLEVATLTFLRLSLTEMRITLHRSLRDWKDHVCVHVRRHLLGPRRARVQVVPTTLLNSVTKKAFQT